MKTLTKSAISAAIIAAMAASSAQADTFLKDFLDDSSVDVNLRNYYRTIHVTDRANDANNDKDKGWAQAVSVGFSSGFFENIIGFDLSTHYVFKLKDSIGDNKESNSGLFLTNSEHNGKTHGHSYGKTLGAVKLNLMDHGIAKYGRMIIDTPLLNDDVDSGSLPSSTEGFYFDYAMHGFTVFGAMAKQGSAEAETGYDEYEVNGKKKSVGTLGGSFEWEGLNLTAAYGKQSDAIKATYLDASYGFDIREFGVIVGAQYGHNKAIGHVKETEIGDGEKSKIDWFGAMAEVDYHDLTVMLAMTDIGGGKKTGWSDAAVGWKGGDDATSFMGYNSVLIDDFHAANETAYQVRVDYDFDNMVPGLSAYALYVMGSIDESTGVDKADTSEYNVGIMYDVQMPMLDGLNFSLVHGKHELDPKGDSNSVTKKETRVIVSYDLAVF